MSTATTVGRWYPNQPPKLDDETDDAYTNRLLGITVPSPYDHRRNRQCSIGWHNECSDRSHSGQCECPHHEQVRNAQKLVDDWNSRFPAGTMVTFPDAPEESPTTTAGPAAVMERSGLEWPMVPLQGFDHPVELAWVAAVMQ